MGGKAKSKEKPKRRRWGRRLLILAVIWLLSGHFLGRPLIRRELGKILNGEVGVRTVVFLPTVGLTAFGVRVQAPNHELEAGSLSIDLKLLGFFGGERVKGVTVSGLEAVLAQGEPLELLREKEPTGAAESAGGGERRGAPRLRFFDPTVTLRDEEGELQEVFSCERLEVHPDGEAKYRIDCGGGELTNVPFERLTSGLVPRSGHLILSEFKLRAFNGMLGGLLDINTRRAGAFNGEIEWHFVEVERVWETYGLAYKEKRRGDLSGSMVFEGWRPSLAALRGTGRLKLDNAEFYSPISFKMFLVLQLPALEESQLTRGEAVFSLERERVFVESVRVFGRSFEWEAQGILTFDGRGDLEIKKGATVLAMRGTMEEPIIKVLPVSALTAPIDRLFRDRIDER